MAKRSKSQKNKIAKEEVVKQYKPSLKTGESPIPLKKSRFIQPLLYPHKILKVPSNTTESLRENEVEESSSEFPAMRIHNPVWDN